MDVCLIPEIKFSIEKLCAYVGKVIKDQGHCVICLAEGCGQSLLGESSETDASGNPVLNDIGDYLKEELKRYFEVIILKKY